MAHRRYRAPSAMDAYFGSGTYDSVQNTATNAYAAQLLRMLEGGSGQVSAGGGGYYPTGRPQAAQSIENPFVTGDAVVGGAGDNDSFARARAIAANPQGDPEQVGRALFGLQGAEAGFAETPTPTRGALMAAQARQKESDRTWRRIQEWKRTANPSAQQMAEVMNAFQAQYSDTANPLDLVGAQDENDPIVGLARDREQIRKLPGYESAWEQMVDPESGRLDFKLINDWRQTSLELAREMKDQTGVSKDDRREALDDELDAIDASLKPTPPGKDAPPEAVKAYRQQQLEYLGHRRRARERFYGPNAQYFYDPAAPDEAPTPSVSTAPQSVAAPETLERAQNIATALNLPFAGSEADYRRLIESKELQPGEYFIDDSGTPYKVGPNGEPVRE